MNGDLLTALDYRRMVDYHRQAGGCLTVAVQERRHRLELGVVHLEDRGTLTAYEEKPETACLVGMGVYVSEPAALRYIEPGIPLDVPALVTRLIGDGQRVIGYRCPEFWLDPGHPADYDRACQAFEQMREAFLPGDRA